jgi:predicted nucleic acid-binding protein
MPDRPFVDTWGWMALGHRREPRHREIRTYYQQLRAQHSIVYTSDYVLDEVITLLFRRAAFAEAVHFLEGLFTAAERGHLRIERMTSERFAAAWRLRQRFQDKPRISFTDLTSMIIMQEHDVRQIVTEDEHFFHVGMGFLKVP